MSNIKLKRRKTALINRHTAMKNVALIRINSNSIRKHKKLPTLFERLRYSSEGDTAALEW
jgi:hypothetical protein